MVAEKAAIAEGQANNHEEKADKAIEAGIPLNVNYSVNSPATQPGSAAAYFREALAHYTAAVKLFFVAGRDRDAEDCFNGALATFKEHSFVAGVKALENKLETLKATAMVEAATPAQLVDLLKTTIIPSVGTEQAPVKIEAISKKEWIKDPNAKPAVVADPSKPIEPQAPKMVETEVPYLSVTIQGLAPIEGAFIGEGQKLVLPKVAGVKPDPNALYKPLLDGESSLKLSTTLGNIKSLQQNIAPSEVTYSAGANGTVNAHVTFKAATIDPEKLASAIAKAGFQIVANTADHQGPLVEAVKQVG